MTKIIRLILPRDSSWLFRDFRRCLRFKLQIPMTCLKYQVAQQLAVIVHICIDGLLFHLDDVLDVSCGGVLTSQLARSLLFPLYLPRSPPNPPAFISHLLFSADLPSSLKWIPDNIPRSAAMDDLILTRCCCKERQDPRFVI